MNYKIVWICIGVGAFIFSSLLGAINNLRSDIARINLTLDKIAKQIGVPDTITENIDIELKSLISEGKRVEAVKRYRMVSGLGLKESKEYIDKLIENELK